MLKPNIFHFPFSKKYIKYYIIATVQVAQTVRDSRI